MSLLRDQIKERKKKEITDCCYVTENILPLSLFYSFFFFSLQKFNIECKVPLTR
jgi:hypothetical protein